MLEDLAFDDFEIIESNRPLYKPRKEQTEHYRVEELRPITPTQPMTCNDKFNFVTMSWKMLVTSWSLVLIASTGVYFYMNSDININENKRLELIRRTNSFQPIKRIDTSNLIQERNVTSDLYGLSHCYKFLGLHTSINSIGHYHQAISFFERFMRDLVNYHFRGRQDQNREKEDAKEETFWSDGDKTICKNLVPTSPLFQDDFKSSKNKIEETITETKSNDNNNGITINKYDLNLIYTWIIQELEQCFNWIPKLKKYSFFSLKEGRENLMALKIRIREQVRLVRCSLLQIRNQCSIKRDECKLSSFINTGRQSMRGLYNRIANIRNN